MHYIKDFKNHVVLEATHGMQTWPGANATWATKQAFASFLTE